jgi:hypothetical protein
VSVVPKLPYDLSEQVQHMPAFELPNSPSLKSLENQATAASTPQNSAYSRSCLHNEWNSFALKPDELSVDRSTDAEATKAWSLHPLDALSESAANHSSQPQRARSKQRQRPRLRHRRRLRHRDRPRLLVLFSASQFQVLAIRQKEIHLARIAR